MKPSVLIASLPPLIRAGRPPFIWGPPGVGKSQMVKQVATSMGLQLIDVRAVLLDPVDLRGLPHVNGGGRTHWAPPEFLPREGEGLLFFDELDRAPQLVQNGLLQLTLDRELGEYRLPDGWSVVAAGNGSTDRGYTTRLSAALANRFTHLGDIEADIDEWTRWAVGAGVETVVIAFLRFQSKLLHAFDPKSKELAFPSPRSWEFVSDALKQTPPKEAEFEIIKGTVGEPAALEFVGFLKVFRQLPSPDAVLMAPDKAAVPEDPATLYALSSTLARKCTQANFDRAIAYAGRMPAEFGVLLVRDAVVRDASLQQTRAFIEWASVNSGVLL